MIGRKAINVGFHNLFHLGIDKEMMEVSLYQLFLNVARNLVALLIPYYLHVELGYTLTQVALFFFVWQLCFTLISPFPRYIIKAIGLKHSIALRSVGSALLWFAIPTLLIGDFVADIALVFPFMLFRALCVMSSEIAYDIFLTHHVHRESKGKTLAFIQVSIMLSAFLAPIVGGMITYFFGFDKVIYLAIFFFALSMIVLLLTPDERVKVPYSTDVLFSDILKNTPKSLVQSEFGKCFFDTMMWVVWPMYLVFILGDVRSMGFIAGCASGISMIVAVIVGKRMDKPKKRTNRNILRHSTIRSFLVNSFRGFLVEPVGLTIVDVAHKVNLQTIRVPYDYEFYRWLKHKNSVERSHIRWIIGENVYTVALLFVTLLFSSFEQSINEVFIILFGLSALSLLWCQNISKCN